MMNRRNTSHIANFAMLLRQRSDAVANVSGSDEYPNIRGCVRLYQTRNGVLIAAEIFGLPDSCGACKNSVFAFHIHSGECCSGNEDDPFADAKTHYNPCNCEHPHHAGDMPPLFANNGYAFSTFLTDRFSVNEIIGKTVIIHSKPDDFTTQPSGNAGEKIACGKIRSLV